MGKVKVESLLNLQLIPRMAHLHESYEKIIASVQHHIRDGGLTKDNVLTKEARQTIKDSSTAHSRFQDTRVAVDLFTRSSKLQMARFEQEMARLRDERAAVLPASPEESYLSQMRGVSAEESSSSAQQHAFEARRSLLNTMVPPVATRSAHGRNLQHPAIFIAALFPPWGCLVF